MAQGGDEAGRERRSGPPSERVSLHRESNEGLNRWARGVRRVPLTHDLLNLAWTAGPVTGLGLYAGYYLAYAEPPHAELLIYFISFTIFSGLLGLAARVLYNSTLGTEKEKAQRRVLECIDRLGDLILAVRDLSVEALEGDARRTEAARQLLQRVRLPPSGLALACDELLGDPELGHCVAQIDAYRRAGLYSRIHDLHQHYDEPFEAALAPLRERAPAAAQALYDRYRARAPRLEAGVPRDEYFVERVLAAAEQDDSLLLTTSDAETMLVLAFELINGREIPMLVVDYTGTWQLARSLHRLERARSRYRLALGAGTNRLRALASWLAEAGVLSAGEAPENLPPQTLVDRIREAMDGLVERLDTLSQRLEWGESEHEQEVRALANTLATSMRLYRKAYEAIRHIGGPHEDMIKASYEWNRMVRQRDPARGRLHFGRTRRGLQIVERTIALDEQAKEAVCEHLMQYLEEHHRRETAPSDGRNPKPDPISLSQARQLAVEVALALDPHIELSRPAVQRGLGASNASYLEDLEPGMSRHEKRTIGETMAREIEPDLGRAAERVAVALVKHYRVELTEEAQEFLAEQYGARRSVLATVARSHADTMPQVSLLSTRPPYVPPPERDWYRGLVRARRLLQRRGRSALGASEPADS